LSFVRLSWNRIADKFAIKGKLGEMKLNFRKILLYQQTILVVSVLSNSSWLPRDLKNGLK